MVSIVWNWIFVCIMWLYVVCVCLSGNVLIIGCMFCSCVNVSVFLLFVIVFVNVLIMEWLLNMRLIVFMVIGLFGMVMMISLLCVDRFVMVLVMVEFVGVVLSMIFVLLSVCSVVVMFLVCLLM